MFNQGVLKGKIIATGVLVGRISKATVYNSYDGDCEEYEGAYEVTPKVEQQTLPTKDKHMTDDVTIKSIPFFSVSNETGGNTVYIAREV